VGLEALAQIVRTILGNAETAFAIVTRKWAPLAAFSEGFMIGICIMFLIVLHIAAVISYIVMVAIGIVLGLAIPLLPLREQWGSIVGKLVDVLIRNPELMDKISITSLVHVFRQILYAMGGLSILNTTVEALIGIGALATVLACIYTVKPPENINKVIWIVSGLAGYFTAFASVGILAVRDTINTVLTQALSSVLPMLIIEVINGVVYALALVLNAIRGAVFMFAFDLLNNIIMLAPKSLIRSLILLGTVAIWLILIISYFSGLSIITAIFTNIITTIFSALGKRPGNRQSYPGFAYFLAILTGVGFAGIMIPLVLLGLFLIFLFLLTVYVVIYVLFEASMLASILEAPAQFFKMLIGNGITQAIWGVFVSYLFYDFLRMMRNSIISASKKFGADPQTVLGIVGLFITISVLTIIGLPGVLILDWIYVTGLPILVAVSLLHACVAGPPTRIRGATAIAGSLLYAITLLLVFGIVGNLFLFVVSPPSAYVSASNIGKELYRSIYFATPLSQTYFTTVASGGVYSTVSPVNMMDPAQKYTIAKYVFLPTIATAYMVVPGKVNKQVLLHILETRCSFSYSIYKQLGMDFNKYIKYKYEIYRAVNEGKEICKLPNGLYVSCTYVANRLGSEYFCDFLLYRLSNMH